MNIKNEESISEYYVILSYSHADREAVSEELKIYDEKGICYWFDEQMGLGENYQKTFFNKLDNDNCKGIIFFITESFLLSKNCTAEIEYFYNNYDIGKPNKFCCFVLPAHFHLSGDKEKSDNAKMLHYKVTDYIKNNPEKETYFNEAIKSLDFNIDVFLNITQNGKSIYGFFGNKEYIEKGCSENQTFEKAGILFGHKRTHIETFGFFPQKENRKYDASNMEKESKGRYLDKNPSFYAPIEWFVIREDFYNSVFLSKELLFAIDYTNLKYPLLPSNKTISMSIEEIFKNDFKEGDNCKYKITKVRFLKENELDILLKRSDNDIKKKRELLLPDFTYYAQISNRKNAPAFWLAGDMEDAQRVDTGIEGLSDKPVGVELYYVRIVIEVEKIGE